MFNFIRVFPNRSPPHQRCASQNEKSLQQTYSFSLQQQHSDVFIDQPMFRRNKDGRSYDRTLKKKKTFAPVRAKFVGK